MDKSSLFSNVELSPHWIAAGKNEVDITIAYGPSGTSVSYQYLHNLSKKTISLTFQGNAETYTVRQLLPDGKQPKRVNLDEKKVILPRKQSKKAPMR